MIGMWKKDTGNYLSHSKGITKEQLEFFKSLKEGDRLILWCNKEKTSEYSPDLTLKVLKIG